jgi:hypothetical protein
MFTEPHLRRRHNAGDGGYAIAALDVSPDTVVLPLAVQRFFVTDVSLEAIIAVCDSDAGPG